METLVLKKDYIVLYVLLGIVYLSGMYLPLMENDSAQHAVMAMRMFLENDFLHLYKGDALYLDKPHMHFWLAAISFKIFGISHWAYRLPAIFFTIIGAISCNRLSKIFYGNEAAHIASLVFLSSQAIVLANHDVRTDAVLTGATIFAVWQLVLFVNKVQLVHGILGGIGLGIAFSSKGQLAVFVAGICVLSHIFYTRKWNVIVQWKTIVSALFFVIAISPVLYAYYIQFDLHPENVVNGKTNVSGLRFILWDQSVDRLTANGFKETSPDYFFFFHTLLWAFLPWSLIAYIALYQRCKQLVRIRFRYERNTEMLTSIGVLVVLIVISFSKFKLPHYLNSLLPILSVLVAGFLLDLYNKHRRKLINGLLFFQIGVLMLGSVLLLFLIFWIFPIPHVGLMLCYLLLIVGGIIIMTISINKMRKLIVVSVYFMILINFCLNTQFYPNLLLYQAGNNAAKIIDREKINPEKVFMGEGRPSWSLDFYTQRITPGISLKRIKNTLHHHDWLFVYQHQLNELKEQQLVWDKKYEINHHRITRLTKKFLNPNTRHTVLEKAFLLRIKKE